MSKKENLYDILGVSETASQEEIKKSYRKLSKIYHPDVKETGDEAKFKSISHAYDILSNPEKKAKYENEGMHAGEHGFGGFGGGFNSSMMDELFRNFGFGRQANRRQQYENIRRRGGDLRIRIPLTIQECVSGVHKKLKINREINCRDCSGTGAKNKESISKCGHCGGSGIVTSVQNTQFGQFVQQTTCHVCNGAGEEIKEKCVSCSGVGLKVELDNIEFDIPAGSFAGMNMMVQRLGNEAKGGGENGNLIVEIVDVEHPILKREGVNIISDIFISYQDAVLGNESLEIDTVDGKVKINIEPGTESGKILRLKGKGIPNVNNPSQRGDHLIFVNIFIPKNITDEEKKNISKLKKVKSGNPDEEKTKHLKGVYARIREYDDLH